MTAETLEQREVPDLRKRAWPVASLVLVPLLLLGAIAAFGGHGGGRRSLVITGAGLEAGWWTKTSIKRVQPRQPTAPATVVASIPSDVLFPEGSAKLEGSASAALRELARALRASSGLITVEGHTDLRGDSSSNKRLGQARADAVARRLVELGVPAGRIATRSLGESEPVCQQTNPDGSDNADCRARCRRVVITYLDADHRPA
jgi:outer membrane protein OmpA-like peptidoglycan-associated protein